MKKAMCPLRPTLPVLPGLADPEPSMQLLVMPVGEGSLADTGEGKEFHVQSHKGGMGTQLA